MDDGALQQGLDDVAALPEQQRRAALGALAAQLPLAGSGGLLARTVLAAPEGDRREQAEKLALVHWDRVARSSGDWLPEWLAWLDEAHAAGLAPRTSAFTLAWRSRLAERGVLTRLSAPDVLAGAHHPQTVRALATAHCQALRIDFLHADLRDATSRYLREWPDDALLEAMAGFAGLGLVHDDVQALEHLDRALDREPGNVFVVTTAMLALRNDAHRHAARIVALPDGLPLSGSALFRAYPAQAPTLFFHRAQARRVLAQQAGTTAEADTHLAAGLRDLGTALENLSGGAPEVLQDFVREREALLDTRVQVRLRADERERRRQEAEADLEAVRAQTGAAVEAVRAQVADSLGRVVEVLGVFVALLAFLFSGGRLAVGTLPTTVGGVLGRAVLVLALAAGIVLFVFLLQQVVRGRLQLAQRSTRPRLWVVRVAPEPQPAPAPPVR